MGEEHPTAARVLPDYWIERPPLSVDPTTEAAIESFLELADAARQEVVIDRRE
jgi:hypothetical protein